MSENLDFVSNANNPNNGSDLNTLKKSIVNYFNSSDFIHSLIESYKLLFIDNKNAFAKMYYAMSIYKLYNLDEIIKILQDSTETEIDVNAFFTLGVLLYEKNNFNNALKYLLLVKEMLFTSEVNYYVALCYSQLNDYINAESYLLQAIKLNPSDLKLYDELRYIYMVQNKDLTEFFDLLQQNSNIDANLNNIEYFNYVADQFIEFNNFEKAIEFLFRSVKISPSAQIYSKIAQCYYNLSDFENAKVNIEIALEIDKDNIDIQLSYLVIMHTLNTTNETVKTFVTDIINKKGDSLPLAINTILFELYGDILFNDGNFLESIKAYEKSIANYKQASLSVPIDLQKKLALVYEKSNQIDKAIDVLEDTNTKLSNLDLVNEDIINNLARLYFQAGNIDKAGDLINQLKELKKNYYEKN